jgi:hypothetical protein
MATMSENSIPKIMGKEHPHFPYALFNVHLRYLMACPIAK